MKLVLKTTKDETIKIDVPEDFNLKKFINTKIIGNKPIEIDNKTINSDDIKQIYLEK